ncbi:MAG: nicotinate phosphoribosyltransferase [Clostridia bacterium]|nr:nicotinate phosphoribosyltransferase [Clostridia bacterium]
MKNSQVNTKISMMMDFYSAAAAAHAFDGEAPDERIVWFDLSFRKDPRLGGFCVTAGLEQAAQALEELSFDEEELSYLSEQGCPAAFTDYLRNMRFSCDIWAVPEGTPVFPNEPVVKVRGPAIQTLLIETLLMQTMNYQSLIATKASRIVRAAQGRRVVEFGARRAHGASAAVCGARAAYIGGCAGTTCVEAAMTLSIPRYGSMTHNFVEMFDSEYEAFKAYAKAFPDQCVLLIDTFGALRSGLPNAIRVFDEVLAPMGKRPVGVRIDSGDLAYLSKRVRRTLNEAGYPDCDVIASNALDEHIIAEMIRNGARVDTFMVGEKLITGGDVSYFPGVYKLVARETDGKAEPVLQLSENVSKIVTPAPKLLWRLYDMETGKAVADLLTTEDEDVSQEKEYKLFDPDYTWKKKTVTNFVARQLLTPVFEDGECVYRFPSLDEIRSYCAQQTDALWEEVLRFEYPHNYYVDLSQKLWDIKNGLIEKLRSDAAAE